MSWTAPLRSGRVLSVVSAVLMIAAAAVLAYPVLTDAWASHEQGNRAGQLDDPTFARQYAKGDVPIGHGLTRLRIPKIGVDVVVVEGTTPSALRAGAGHYVGTPLPGAAGNVAIAGHRTTFGRPFNRLDEVRPGDEVLLDSPTTEYVYRAVPSFDGAANPHAVDPTDVAVIGGLAPGHWLTLTTCTPKGSAAQRLIARFTLVGSHPKKA
jgi:sortase A